MLSQTKGFRWRRKSSIRLAKQALTRAGQHAYRHRKLKKRDMAALWNIRVNAAARLHGLTYSTLMHKLKQNSVGLNRRVLQELASEHPEVFAAILQDLKG